MDDRLGHRQIWRFVNALSLDAVAVGLLWQFVFTRQFCQRLPEPHEIGIIGMSIWLAYTADRLLDSIGLDIHLPHSFRHQFHFQYRKPLCFLWFVSLGINAANIVCFATETQLRWGFVAIAFVAAYIIGIQISPLSKRVFPKELQAGMVFAFGVSLTAWTEVASHEITALLVSMLMTGLLVAGNCLAIAGWERDFDSNQHFDSFALRKPESLNVLPYAFLVHGIVGVVLCGAGALPPLVLGCLIASDGMLIVLCLVGQRIGGQQESGTVSFSTSPIGVTSVLVSLADVALMIPPLGWAMAETMT